MRFYRLIIVPCLFVSGCAVLQAPPSSLSGFNPACSQVQELSKVQDCGVRLASDYALRGAEILRQRERSGLASIGLVGVAGAVELVDGSRRITQGSGLLSSVMAGTDQYTTTNARGLLLLSSAGQIQCLLDRAPPLVTAVADHQSALIGMQETYEAVEKSSADRVVQQSMDQMYAVCERTDASEVAGGYVTAQRVAAAKAAALAKNGAYTNREAEGVVAGLLLDGIRKVDHATLSTYYSDRSIETAKAAIEKVIAELKKKQADEVAMAAAKDALVENIEVAEDAAQANPKAAAKQAAADKAAGKMVAPTAAETDEAVADVVASTIKLHAELLKLDTCILATK